MMSNCNSPLLHRASPHRAESVDRGDAFKLEKDLVIGELTCRMKSRVPRSNKAGFNKNSRRDDGDDFDDFDDLRAESPAPNSSSSAVPSFSNGFKTLQLSQPEPVLARRRDLDEDESASEVARPFRPTQPHEVTSSASINPTRTSSASIRLAPSPKVTRRNRSKSPNSNNGPRMSRMTHSFGSSSTSSHLSNGSSSGHGSTCSSSASAAGSSSLNGGARARSGNRPVVGLQKNGSANGRPTSTQRSISLQPSYNNPRSAAASGPRTRGAPTNVSSRANGSSNGVRANGGGAGSSSLKTMNLQNGGGSHSFNRSISANPDLNDPAIQARIGNRATKVVQKSIGKCGACAKPINEDGCTAFGKVYHKNCFKCHVCRQKIQGKFFEKDGKPYCQKDFMNNKPALETCSKCGSPIESEGDGVRAAGGRMFHPACVTCHECDRVLRGNFFLRADGRLVCSKDCKKAQESCTVCGQPIKGDSVVSNSKVFHPECMKCYVCGVGLRGQYFTYQDKPICEMHYKQHADKCSICHEVPTGRYFAINNDVVCEECHVGGSQDCPRCGEAVVGSKMVKINGGATFHTDCFTCVVCKRSMAHAQFVADDKLNIYCPEDYNRKRAPKCSFCKKPIVPKEGERTAPRLRAMDRDFHPACFQCEDCGLVLDSRVKGRECYPFKNHILCIKCNRKKLSSSEESDDDSDDEYHEE